MPRCARILEQGGVSHVHVRGNNKADIFHSDADRHGYLNILQSLKKECSFQLFHYVLMSNHVHLILRPDPMISLSKVMQKLNLRYSLWYKRHYKLEGHLWQCRFKSHPITDDSYLLTCGAYVELNPVRAGVVDAPEKYPWSSYRYYVHGEYDALVDMSMIYLTLGGDKEQRQKEYSKIVDMWRDIH